MNTMHRGIIFGILIFFLISAIMVSSDSPQRGDQPQPSMTPTNGVPGSGEPVNNSLGKEQMVNSPESRGGMTTPDNQQEKKPEPVQTSSPQTTHEAPISPTQPITQNPSVQPNNPGPTPDRNTPDREPMPQPSRERGSIHVTSSPTGAYVYLNNELKGVTPSTGYLEISDLSSGTYTLLITSPGYDTYTTTVSLSRGETESVSTKLSVTQSVTPTASTGTLSIQSSPANAGVLLDNAYKGITPLTLQDIPSGDHTLIVQKQGYNDYSSTIHVSAEQANALSVTLQQTATATPTTVTTPVAEQPTPLPTKSPLPVSIPICAVLVGCLFIWVRR